MKRFILLGCMIASAFTACQKDEISDPNIPEIDEPQGPQITHTFTVSQSEWTRSAYVEGQGVKITGDEHISVYYGDHQYLSDDNTAASKLQKVEGTPNGNGTYSFSHSEIASAKAYDYYFIMPNTATNNSQSKGHRPNIYLNTIQYPTANSFDPAQDYMVGTPKYGIDIQTDTSVGELHFKRLFAPFHITFKGVPAGEKIRYATVMQSNACTRNAPLVGTAYLSFEDPEKSEQEKKSTEFDYAMVNNWLSSGFSNHVTAYYADGLTTNSGQGEVWYIVNPTVCGSDDPTSISGDMTMRVVTDNKLLTRTVSLAKPIKFTANALNEMGFNITGSGYTEEDAFTQDFTALTAGNKTGNQTLTASNGINYTWNFTSGCKVQNNGLYAPATGATFTLPKPAGQKIKQILILPGLLNPNNSGVSTLQLKADGVDVGAPYDFNTQRMLTESASGYLIIDVPTAYQSAQLSLVKPASDANATYISAITFVTEAEPNDYFALYQNGEDITIGEGANMLTINKESHPGGQVVYLDTKDTHDKIRTMMQNGGIYFVDTYHNSDESEVANAVLTWTSHFKPGGTTILIGRYKDKQANLALSGTAAIYLSNSNGLSTLALKNLNIVSENAGYLFTINNESTQQIEALYVDDCTIDAPKHVYGYSKNTMDHVCKNTFFHNSLIKMSGVDASYSVFRMQKAVGSAAPYDYTTMPYRQIERVEFVNCVFYATEAVNCSEKNGVFTPNRRTIIDAGNGDTDSGYQYPMENLDIVFRNNTCYNIHANGNILIRAYIARSANVSHNVFYADGTIATSNKADQLAVTSDCYIFGLYGHHPTVYAPADDSDEAIAAAVSAEQAAYQVVNNYAMSYGSSMAVNGWKWAYKNGDPVNYTNSGNTGKWKQATANDCFTSTINAAIGYFPVNTSKVTNGAGATYETKLWKAWE